MTSMVRLSAALNTDVSGELITRQVETFTNLGMSSGESAGGLVYFVDLDWDDPDTFNAINDIMRLATSIPLRYASLMHTQ
ncbi:hypothetical protein ABGB18_35660 [Nonomuraea sp. B12E4]|uniref:hypothetical protein n=1 Tax=Nonomuraea sp. B12E4 TaxID=3153564 RepID=UPI00325C8DC8